MSDYEEIIDIPVKGRDQEAALIAAILRYPSGFDDCEFISPADFGWRAYGEVWQAMQNLKAQKLGIDSVTVADELDRMGKLQTFQRHGSAQFVGRAALFELRSAAIPGENASTYAMQVKDYAAKRQILSIMNTGAEWSLNGRRANDILRDLSSKLSIIEAPGKVATGTRTLAELSFDENVNILAAAGSDQSHIIKTGWIDIDRLFSGFEAPDMTIIAALPGMGKTALITSIIKNIYDIRPDKRQLIHSLEMSGEQVYRRLISAEAGISYAAQKTGRLTPQEWQKYNAAREQMEVRANIHINDIPAVNLAQVRAEIRRLRPDIVFIDYIQLMTHMERTEKRNEQVAQVARGIKNLCKEFSIPIVCAAQLSRESVKESRPRLQHLAESAELERAADNVFFLHRKDETDTETEVILAKCRNGQVGTEKLVFVPQRTRFENLAR